MRCALETFVSLNPGVSHCSDARKAGGADRDRTGDLKLAKLPLSQLSYGPGIDCLVLCAECLKGIGWWAEEELNFRPHAYQACALTT